MQNNNFNDFRKLYRSVSVLFKASSYIDIENRDCISDLESLARKMEIAQYIHQKNIIAVAGMQGSGKTSLVKAIYNLPDGILPAGSERGEKIPVFITESKDLKEGEYRAKAVSFELGERLENELSVNEISGKCRRGGNTAYIELFVPAKYFTCENAGFVLLPGFEKNSHRGFDDEYNSIIDYTLHFANAVILATDSAGIANEEIDKITEMLGEKFDPSNCVFAITKGDTSTAEEQAETKESLLQVCRECGLDILSDQVVSTGIYQTDEENDVWMENLFDAIGREGLLNYESTKREHLFYKPMVDEMLFCAQKLENSLNVYKNIEQTPNPLYDELKKALSEMGIYLEREMNVVCAEVKKEAKKNFVEKSKHDKELKKHIKIKKFLVLKKSYAQEYEDKEAIARVCNDCLTTASQKSLFVERATQRLLSESNKDMIKDKFVLCINGTNENNTQNSETVDEDQKLLNEYVKYALISRNGNLPSYPDNGVLCEAISASMYASFCNILQTRFDCETLDIKTNNIKSALASAEKIKAKGGEATAALGAFDLLDGKADIIDGIISLFIEGGEIAAETTAIINAVAAAAIVVAVAAKKGINYYNANVERKKVILEAWENSLLNAVDEQKNNWLDIYDEACKNLLDHIQKLHNKRNNLGETQQRIANAQYAIADIRDLANRLNDQYADKLEEKYGE